MYENNNGFDPNEQNGNSGSFDSRDENRNQGINTDNYFNEPPKDQKPPKKQSGSKGFMILSILLICALMCSVCYNLGKTFSNIANERPSVSDPNADGSDDNKNPVGSPTVESPALQNGSFKLETVTADEHYKLSSVYQLTKNTVVEITTESMQTGSFMQQYVTTGAGSGVIITSDGYIATNNHVIDGATKITVTLTSGEKHEAKLVGADAKTDLAVIKIEASELPAAKIGISGDLLVGEDILIIGNPLGSLGGSLTDGIVSATARQISIEGQLMTLIQTNAAVNPGNSGGAMFNMSGQLVGIVNAKYTDEAVEGIGFAIPMDIAKPVIEDLTNWGYVKGRVNLGLTIEYGTSKYISSVGAANWITAVSEGSDAEKSGLKVMDQVVSLNGNTFTSAEALNAYIDTLKVGQTLEIVIKRYTAVSSSFWGTQYSSEEMTFKITLTEYLRTN